MANYIRHHLGLILASAFLGLLVVEGGVRVAGYTPQVLIPPGLYTNHPHTWWTPRPGFTTTMATPDGEVRYQINQQGIRADHPITLEEGAQLVITLGDSFTFGWGVNVEESYPYLLDTMLRKHNPRLKVVNLGVPGFGTAQELARLREYSDWLGLPAVVIHMFCPNDPVDNLTGNKEVMLGVRVDAASRFKPLQAVLGVAYHHSRLLALVLDQLYVRFFNPRFTATRAFNATATPITERQDWLVTRDRLRELGTWTRHRNSRLLVATTADSIYDPALTELLDQEGIPFLAMGQMLHASGHTMREIQLAHDGHWNRLGNQLVAAALFQKLNELGLPPPAATVTQAPP